MTLDQLLALGAVTFGNQIDFRNKTIGLVTPDGEAVLTPEGMEMVEAAAPSAEKPKPRRTRIAAAAGTAEVNPTAEPNIEVAPD